VYRDVKIPGPIIFSMNTDVYRLYEWKFPTGNWRQIFKDCKVVLETQNFSHLHRYND
jgi:hypothetical protein